MSQELQQLILDIREQIAMARELRARRNATVDEYISKNDELLAISEAAVAQSRMLLART